MMHSLLLSAAALLAAAPLTRAQTVEFDAWNTDRLDRKRDAMRVLTGWGASNVAVGGAVALASDDGVARAAGAMSAGWGAINAALGLFGLRGARRDRAAGQTVAEAAADLRRTEKILLFNAGLDVGYVAAGAYLTARADRPGEDDPARLRGWGRAVMLQGAALFAFDLLAYRHLHVSDTALSPTFGGQGVGLSATKTF